MSIDPKLTSTPDGPEADGLPSNKKKPKAPLRRRLLRSCLFLLYVLILAEVASRGYWAIKHRERDMPFFPGKRDWYDRFYEELRDSRVLEADLRPDDGHFDILMLGGSALDRFHHSLAAESRVLQDDFRRITPMPVRVFNLAAPAMTTRESLIKYRIAAEEGKRFDLIIVYHGINDTRLNNVAAGGFKDDYTHSGFYKQFQRLRAYGPAALFLS